MNTQETNNKFEEICSLEEAAKAINRTKRTIYNLRSQGKIPKNCFIKLYGRLLVHKPNFMNWVMSGTEA